MILEQPTCHTSQRDQQFVKAVEQGSYKQLEIVEQDDAFIEALELNDRDRKRRQLAFDAGLGRGVQERYNFTLQPFKQRSQRLAKLETIAMLLIGIALYGTVALSLLAVIKANI